MKRLTDGVELLDGPLDDRATLAGNLRDLRRINRWLGGVRLSAAGIEALMIVLALWLVDWSNRTHVLVFVMSVLGYTIVVLGLVALGAHVSRASSRIVAVLETMTPR